nr:uncharacterized protein LOC117278260 [Nicotiana tomentosiformis]
MDLRPWKRRAIDRGAGVPIVVDLSKASPKAEEQDVATNLVEEDVGVVPKALRLEKADNIASSRSEGNEAVMNASSEVPALLGHEEAPSAEQAQIVPQVNKGNGKLPSEKGDGEAEFLMGIGNESDSDLYTEEHEMIDSGVTQVEVQVGGSRMIIIPGITTCLKISRM